LERPSQQTLKRKRLDEESKELDSSYKKDSQQHPKKIPEKKKMQQNRKRTTTIGYILKLKEINQWLSSDLNNKDNFVKRST
jgi:hypothetical protein